VSKDNHECHDQPVQQSGMSRRRFITALSAAIAATPLASADETKPKPQGTVLSTAAEKSVEVFDVVIIGTGFGASVAATKLAEKLPQEKRVLVIERGVWFITPERPLPDYLKNHPKERVNWWPRPDNATGMRDFLSVVAGNPFHKKGPLYRYDRFKHVDVVSASGVGGGSLIYSNVSLRPYYDQAAGKFPVMHGWDLKLTNGDYDLAESWMQAKRSAPNRVVTTVPVTDPKYNVDKLGKADFLYLGRSRALRNATRNLPSVGKTIQRWEEWKPLNLQVFEYDGSDHSKWQAQRFCERQGRCFLGCLPAARHTLNKTLITHVLNLPNFILKTATEVNRIRPSQGGGYEVVCSGNYIAQSKVVIVAAGCLGSTEILLRSQHDLKLSKKLGEQFSTNGDFSGFVVGIPPDLNGVENRVFPTKGPINTSHVTYKSGEDLYINVEDAGIPSMFAALTKRVLELMVKGEDANAKASATERSAFVASREMFLSSLHKLWNSGDASALLDKHQTEHEMLQDVMWFNCMGRDDAGGKFTLKGNGRLDLTLSTKPENMEVFKKAEELLRAMANELQGKFVPFPLWNSGLWGLVSKKVVVTHPLGGCPIGNSSTSGVVDPEGRVFNTSTGASTVHPGLFVMDASTVPGPLAVNPTLTIVALALRAAEGVKKVLGLPPG